MMSSTVLMSAETLCEKDAIPIRTREVVPALAALNPQLRQRPRVAYRRAVLAIPVRPDGGPDWESRVSGFTTDIGVEGVGLEFSQHANPRSVGLIMNLQTMGLVLSLSGQAGQPPGCLGVEISNTQDVDADSVRLGAQFSGFASEFLKAENLTPRLNARTWQFELAYSEAILDQWAAIGVLEPLFWDRVQLCPRCQGLPTFRRGCTACGSSRLTNDRLIHHFACAHVGLISEFEERNELVCPKCRTRHMIIGSDYEYLTGPYRCQDCKWTGTELEQVAQCLRCELRFPVNQAHEQELKGYRAHRLDPLALLPSLGPTAALPVRAAPDRRAALCVH